MPRRSCNWRATSPVSRVGRPETAYFTATHDVGRSTVRGPLTLLLGKCQGHAARRGSSHSCSARSNNDLLGAEHQISARRGSSTSCWARSITYLLGAGHQIVARRGSLTPPKPPTEGLPPAPSPGRSGERNVGWGDLRSSRVRGRRPAHSGAAREPQRSPRTAARPAHHSAARAPQRNPRTTILPAHYNIARALQHHPRSATTAPRHHLLEAWFRVGRGAIWACWQRVPIDVGVEQFVNATFDDPLT